MREKLFECFRPGSIRRFLQLPISGVDIAQTPNQIRRCALYNAAPTSDCCCAHALKRQSVLINATRFFTYSCSRSAEREHEYRNDI